MKYDFDRVISRKNTDCIKWDGAKILFGDEDIIPMWVADMDIPIAKPVSDAIRNRTEHEIYGYPVHSPVSVIEAVRNRMKDKYGWEIKPEWIVFTPGIVPALYAAVKAYTVPGDDVILQSPVYYPFSNAIRDNGCQIAGNQLTLADGRYEIDFDDLRSKFSLKTGRPPLPSRVRLMLLCNPHNPVGRVWTREELARMGEIVVGNGAVIVSDEVHSEILFNEVKHIPFAMLSEKFEQFSVTCVSPSKTFNLAGLGASAIIIPDGKLRARFHEAKRGIMPAINIFGLVAMEAAFRYGDEWLEQFIEYLHGNLEFLLEYFDNYIPKIKVIKPEGTYLVWLDCRELGMDPKKLKIFMTKKAKVGLDEGGLFGPGGEGFKRMNIACPRGMLGEALERIRHAVMSL